MAPELSTAELVKLVDLAHDAILVRDLDGRIAFWNLGAAALYGWRSEQAIGRVSHDLLQTRFPLPMPEIDRLLLRHGAWEGELVHRTAAGKEVVVASRWVLRRDSAPPARIVMEINRDITSARRTEHALLESERALANVFDTTREAIQIIGPDGRLRYANPAWRTLLGYEADHEIHALTFADIVPEREQAPCHALLRRALAGWSGNVETVLLSRGGDEIAVEGSIGARFDGGAPVSVHAFFRDIRERKRIEADRARLLQAERRAKRSLAEQNRRLRELDSLKDEFLALISHELRTPLLSITGFVGLLTDDGVLATEKEHRYLTIVDRNAKRLLRLVDDVLLITEIEANRFSLNLEPVDLRKIVSDVVEAAQPAADTAGVAMEFVLPSRPLGVLADEVRIAQLLDNLIRNAIKYTPADGRVSISCRSRGRSAEVAVSDTGIGIDPAELPRLFERFYRTRAVRDDAIPGCGLGLSIARAIAEHHGGAISVASKPGSGSAFTFTLPRRVDPRLRPGGADSRGATRTARSSDTRSP